MWSFIWLAEESRKISKKQENLEIANHWVKEHSSVLGGKGREGNFGLGEDAERSEALGQGDSRMKDGRVWSILH